MIHLITNFQKIFLILDIQLDIQIMYLDYQNNSYDLSACGALQKV